MKVTTLSDRARALQIVCRVGSVDFSGVEASSTRQTLKDVVRSNRTTAAKGEGCASCVQKFAVQEELEIFTGVEYLLMAKGRVTRLMTVDFSLSSYERIDSQEEAAVIMATVTVGQELCCGRFGLSLSIRHGKRAGLPLEPHSRGR